VAIPPERDEAFAAWPAASPFTTPQSLEAPKLPFCAGKGPRSNPGGGFFRAAGSADPSPPGPQPCPPMAVSPGDRAFPPLEEAAVELRLPSDLQGRRSSSDGGRAGGLVFANGRHQAVGVFSGCGAVLGEVASFLMSEDTARLSSCWARITACDSRGVATAAGWLPPLVRWLVSTPLPGAGVFAMGWPRESGGEPAGMQPLWENGRYLQIQAIQAHPIRSLAHCGLSVSRQTSIFEQVRYIL